MAAFSSHRTRRHREAPADPVVSLLAVVAVIAPKRPERIAFAKADIFAKTALLDSTSTSRFTPWRFRAAPTASSPCRPITGLPRRWWSIPGDLCRPDLRNRKGPRPAAGAARIQCRCSNRGWPDQGGAAMADRMAIGKLVERSVQALVVPARPDEDQFARHELSRSSGRFRGPRRPPDAARLPGAGGPAQRSPQLNDQLGEVTGQPFSERDRTAFRSPRNHSRGFICKDYLHVFP